jgi:hypothetical protein
MNMLSIETSKGNVRLIFSIEVIESTEVLCIFDESKGSPDSIPTESNIKEVLKYLRQLLPECPLNIALKTSTELWCQISVATEQLIPLITPCKGDRHFVEWFVQRCDRLSA